jgi:hypothetical protein
MNDSDVWFPRAVVLSLLVLMFYVSIASARYGWGLATAGLSHYYTKGEGKRDTTANAREYRRTGGGLVYIGSRSRETGTFRGRTGSSSRSFRGGSGRGGK